MDEYLAMLAELSIPEDYHPNDRYHDFRKVFLETDEGRRVLKLILSWGHMLNSHAIGKPVDANRILLSEGGRNLALRILAVMMVEPPVKQTKQSTKDKG